MKAPNFPAACPWSGVAQGTACIIQSLNGEGGGCVTPGSVGSSGRSGGLAGVQLPALPGAVSAVGEEGPDLALDPMTSSK